VVAQARALADAFNATAELTTVRFFIIAGRIAPSDAEAVRAINSEVRDLLDEMAIGVRELDAEAIRSAATRARGLGQMLSPEAAAKIQVGIDAARGAARQIVKAGEGAQVVDRFAVAKLLEARTMFLDMDEGAAVAAPAVGANVLDLAS
jgi:hypothetical protein